MAPSMVLADTETRVDTATKVANREAMAAKVVNREATVAKVANREAMAVKVANSNKGATARAPAPHTVAALHTVEAVTTTPEPPSTQPSNTPKKTPRSSTTPLTAFTATLLKAKSSTSNTQFRATSNSTARVVLQAAQPRLPLQEPWEALLPCRL